MRTCSHCRKLLPLEKFGWKNKAHGIRTYRCRDCLSEYGREWHQANRERNNARIKQWQADNFPQRKQLIDKYKSSKGCADCGESDPVVLDFDHIRDKAFNIAGKYARYSMERIWAEIEKCEVVCSNCHRRRTHTRRLSETGLTPPL